MFYSHEILTSPQHGVATIWLVATLGSKSNLKKVTRRAILDVDVPKACSKITDPAAPMALRLQGSLLYGVTRVFSQQCAYVLADSQSYRDKMRGIATIMKDLDLDQGTLKARSEQLNIADDPTFIPELDMNLDLSIFDIPHDVWKGSRSQSPNTLGSGHISPPAEIVEDLALELPSNDTSGDFDDFDIDLGVPINRSSRSESRLGILDELEQPALDIDPGFDISADGEVLFGDDLGDQYEAVLVPPAGMNPSANEPDFDLVTAAGHEAEQMTPRKLNVYLPDDDEQILMDDDSRLPEAEPFPPTALRTDISSGQAMAQSSPARPSEDSMSHASVEAPQRAQPKSRELVVDLRAELSNKQLGEWNTKYLENMARSSHLKLQHKSFAQAKKNAAFWVLEQGIGGVRANFGDEREAHPFAMFSGRSLMDLFVRIGSNSMSSKRSRSSSGDIDENGLDGVSRRVRARNGEQESVETPGQVDVDEGDMVQDDDDYLIESERGREAPPSLQDHSSVPPWNIVPSSIRHGSLLPLGAGSSSAGGRTGAAQYGLSSSLHRRGPRLTSASPLHGRGMTRMESIEPYILPSETGSNDAVGDDLPVNDATSIDQFELYGPAATVDSQTAEQSQWLATTLESEAHNFFMFLKTQILDHKDHDDSQQPGVTITMDQLLPPAEHTRVVAAQALLHILSLATKGLIEIDQAEGFNDIHMSITPEH